MTKNWEEAERTVQLLTGGKRTPGSGSGRIKGDVRVQGADGSWWMIEVKSTVGNTIRLQRSWLSTLEKHRHGFNLALVLVSAQYTTVYVFEHGSRKDGWSMDSKSLEITEDSGKPVPDTIRVSSFGLWEAWLPEELSYETKGK